MAHTTHCKTASEHILRTALILPAFLLVVSRQTSAQQQEHAVQPSIQSLTLENGKVRYSILLDSNRIVSDRLEITPVGAQKNSSHVPSVTTGADFALSVVWTDWQAPKTLNNAENPVQFTKEDFRVDRHEFAAKDNGTRELILYLHGNDFPLSVRLTLQLDSSAMYVRRKLTAVDTSEAGHFLQWIFPHTGIVSSVRKILNDGGFGQPVAFSTETGGAFFGMEYPAAENTLTSTDGKFVLQCGQEIGTKIEGSGTESAWCIEGIAPDTAVKQWFMKYVDDIRVAQLKPFTLYNSWYDLRSAEYPNVPEANTMNEENIFRIIDRITENMIEKHNIHLDAFVLDDGWDVYESDWVLRERLFPHGLKPISDKLKETNTALGMWFGPTGGYSFRMKRIDWMKQHGYEVVGHTKNTAMLCLAGERYSVLFRKRVTDFAERDGVGYFKWDGIQFSCSEPDHGHPVGMYSRRAVMESVIDKCRAVREINPNVFLNITSGTWLSPWWVQYANQIWMQGEDYGYADVPSISPRDAAMTYRDLVLYDDFTRRNQWFPIANLMTHGIIKGTLQMLGGNEEPIDRFTNEALLYFARGVSMWELYISPDILTEEEWRAISESIAWARDRFPLLMHTEMIGGDPGNREPYGYAHFSGQKGIIAARNPWIESSTLKTHLNPSLGVDPHASSLVLERIYPTRWISPRLYRVGDSLELPLEGYETAIYEIAPLSGINGPLPAGVEFDASDDRTGKQIQVFKVDGDARMLNTGKDTHPHMRVLMNTLKNQAAPVKDKSISSATGDPSIHTTFALDSSVVEATLEVLLTPGNGMKKLPDVVFSLPGIRDTVRAQSSGSRSAWYTTRLSAGTDGADVHLVLPDNADDWNGTAELWITCKQRQRGITVELRGATSLTNRIMPPRPLPPGITLKHIRLGSVTF